MVAELGLTHSAGEVAVAIESGDRCVEVAQEDALLLLLHRVCLCYSPLHTCSFVFLHARHLAVADNGELPPLQNSGYFVRCAHLHIRMTGMLAGGRQTFPSHKSVFNKTPSEQKTNRTQNGPHSWISALLDSSAQ